MPIARIVSLLLVLAAASSPASALAHRSVSGRGSPGCAHSHWHGLGNVTLTSGGLVRPFLLYVPRGYTGHRPLPLVLNLHGSGNRGGQQMLVSQIAAVADRRRFLVAAPDGAVPSHSGYAWNVPGVPLLGGKPVPEGTPSDEGYLLDVIRKVKGTVCTDWRRVYLTGYSGGARMSSQMACDYSDRIAAIAAVAGLRAGVPQKTPTGAWEPAPATCEPKQPVALLAFHGTADQVNPYMGSDSARWGYGIETALAHWAELDGCTLGPWTSAAAATVDLVSFWGCRRGATVALYRQRGGGHTWPTGQSSGVDASDLIWKFFAQHALPPKR